MDLLVGYATEGAVARLTLDSPHNRNALSAGLVTQLHEGLRRAAEDPAVRAIVLGHTGGTFCAGADLSEASGSDPYEAALGRARELTALLRAIVECPVPVIGAIDGHVRAGGMGLIGACDIVIAGPRSTFALTEARIGGAGDHLSHAAAQAVVPGGVTLLPDRRDVQRRTGCRHRVGDDVRRRRRLRRQRRHRRSGQGLAAGINGLQGADDRSRTGRLRPRR